MCSDNSGTGGEGSTYEGTPTTTRSRLISPYPEASTLYGYYHDPNSGQWVWGRRNLSDMFQRAGPLAKTIPRANVPYLDGRAHYGFYSDTSNPGRFGWGRRVLDGSFYRAAPSMTRTSSVDASDNHGIDNAERPSRARSPSSTPQATREYRAYSEAPSPSSVGNGVGSSTDVQHPLESNTIHEAQNRERETPDHLDTSDLPSVENGAEPSTRMADEEQDGEREIAGHLDSSDTSHVEEAESRILVAPQEATGDLIPEGDSVLPDAQQRGRPLPLGAGSSLTENKNRSSQEEAQQRQLEDTLESTPATTSPNTRRGRVADEELSRYTQPPPGYAEAVASSLRHPSESTPNTTSQNTGRGRVTDEELVRHTQPPPAYTEVLASLLRRTLE